MNKETDSSEQNHTCEGCGEVFTQKQDFYRHPCTYVLMKPTQKYYECELCSKQFKRPNTLKVHFRLHTGEKPYTCTICSRKFTQNGALRSHILTHRYNVEHMEFIKPYRCDLCGNEYEKKIQLTLHRRTHVKEELFACDVCKKMFSAKATLSEHRETHSEEKS